MSGKKTKLLANMPQNHSVLGHIFSFKDPIYENRIVFRRDIGVKYGIFK